MWLISHFYHQLFSLKPFKYNAITALKCSLPFSSCISVAPLTGNLETRQWCNKMYRSLLASLLIQFVIPVWALAAGWLAGCQANRQTDWGKQEPEPSPHKAPLIWMWTQFDSNPDRSRSTPRGMQRWVALNRLRLQMCFTGWWPVWSSDWAKCLVVNAARAKLRETIRATGLVVF